MLEITRAPEELMLQVSRLEQRVAQLEIERNQLRASLPTALPQTNLLSPNFLTRAFAIWGHYFVASFFIGLAASVVYCLVMLVLGGAAAVLGNLGN